MIGVDTTHALYREVIRLGIEAVAKAYGVPTAQIAAVLNGDGSQTQDTMVEWVRTLGVCHLAQRANVSVDHLEDVLNAAASPAASLAALVASPVSRTA